MQSDGSDAHYLIASVDPKSSISFSRDSKSVYCVLNQDEHLKYLVKIDLTSTKRFLRLTKYKQSFYSACARNASVCISTTENLFGVPTGLKLIDAKNNSTLRYRIERSWRDISLSPNGQKLLINELTEKENIICVVDIVAGQKIEICRSLKVIDSCRFNSKGDKILLLEFGEDGHSYVREMNTDATAIRTIARAF